MPKICYTARKFKPDTLALITQANVIIEEYAAQGLTLTLRQLYYQFVSRDLIPNRQTEYKRLGSVINDARLAGLLDWAAIEDRTRNLISVGHWDSPADILRGAARSYHRNLWVGQQCHVEVWVEKDALAGVLENACRPLDVAVFPCKGYVSQSEMWAAAQRLLAAERDRGQMTVILHFGDHDPSGLDMSRDIRDRLHLFKARPTVVRVALNMDQIEKYGPPPNPAKDTDARFADYRAQYGDASWELDALEPTVLRQLVEQHVARYRDDGLWDEQHRLQERERDVLNTLAQNWVEPEDDEPEDDEPEDDEP